MAVSVEQGMHGLTVLMQLEAETRKAQTDKALQFLIVNETRRLLPYRQAFLFSSAGDPRSRCRLEAASSIAVIDRDVPLIRWLELALHAMRGKDPPDAVERLDSSTCPQGLAEEWREFSLPYVLWCPLCRPDGAFLGGLWLARETVWRDDELTLMKRLCDAYAHAWAMFAGKRRLGSKWRSRRVGWSLVAVAGAAMFLPVRLSTLAPVEVVAKDPIVVSAPLDGVIAKIMVPPNRPVSEGDLLFTFEDTSFRNGYEVAERALEVALAEFHKAAQGAFQDAKSKAEVALLRARVELSKAERNYARDLLTRMQVHAQGVGLLLYSDEADWIGRPVVVGERVMEIADPKRTELRIDLAVADSIILSEGAEVKCFLDVDPLHALQATVTHASYKAEVLPGDLLAYRVHADLKASDSTVRIGLQGTAKIYSEPVALFFYLFRRPIGAIRQFIGF
ncbi:MAG: efflux RND transporter periplasmic adaptor subunit [Gammaproteobacteria bacterium]